MKHVEGTFAGVREMEIFYQSWLPEGDPKAVLLIVHGIGEHSGRYQNIVDFFLPRGFAIYALDHIGHGRSEGEREIVDKFADYSETLKIYFEMVKVWQPGKPIFAIGHSLGGAITCFYLLDYPEDLKGAVISAPAIVLGEDVTPFLIFISKLLSRIAPRMGVLELDASALSRDPEVVKAYHEDPLVYHGKSPARAGAELVYAMTRITDEVEQIKDPIFVIQGSEDRIVESTGAQMLFDRAGSADKNLKFYEGMFHEIYNEPDRDRVLNDVEAWLEARL